MTQVTDACRNSSKVILARDSHTVPETVLVRPRAEPVGRGALTMRVRGSTYRFRPLAGGWAAS